MSEIIIPGQEQKPKEDFIKKDNDPVNPRDAETVNIPPIYYWEDVVDGISIHMTMAFKWNGLVFGETWEIPEDKRTFQKISIMRRKLFPLVRDTLDVLIHHEKQVLNSNGNIDSKIVNDCERRRYGADPNWKKKVDAFRKLVRVHPITKKHARKIGLL